MAERLESYLQANGYSAAALTGDVPQKKRQATLERFKNQKLNILIATDVASRGLHIDAVTHVFNFDLPQDAEDYIHRIGRTARIGATGIAIALAGEEDAFYLEAIEKLSGKIPVLWAEEEDFIRHFKRPSRSSSGSYDRKSPGSNTRGGRSGSYKDKDGRGGSSQRSRSSRYDNKNKNSSGNRPNRSQSDADKRQPSGTGTDPANANNENINKNSQPNQSPKNRPNQSRRRPPRKYDNKRPTDKKTDSKQSSTPKPAPPQKTPAPAAPPKPKKKGFLEKITGIFKK